MRRFQVVVIGDSQAAEAACALAEEVGAVVARRGAALITGGRGGVMEAASRGARSAGGLTIGIVPSERLSEGNRWCDVVIPTGMGWARNAVNALAADLVVAIGGRAGTLTEIGYAWAYGRPVAAFADAAGWAARLAGEPVDDRREDRVIRLADVAALDRLLAEHMALHGKNGGAGNDG